MTLLNTNYGSGNIVTAGNTGGTVGVSGINDITNRVNFANYDYPNNGSMTFTYVNSQITQVVISGTDQSYVTDIRYKDAGFMVGSVVTSGTTLGSIIITELFSNGAQFVSGTVSVN